MLSLTLAAEARGNSADDCLSLASARDAQACINRTEPFSRLALDSEGNLVVARSISAINGEFSHFAGNDPDQLRSPLLAKALANERKRLLINVGEVDPIDLSYDISMSTIPDESKSYQGALMASTYGPDVSGRDIATWYHRQILGGGYVATISATYGFSELRKTSKDGEYDSIFLDLEKAFAFGLVNASYSQTHNQAGGESLIYVLGGETQRYSASLTNWITPKWRVMQKIEHTEREQKMGVFDLHAEQRYSSGVAEIAFEDASTRLSAKLKKGVDGNESFNYIPLMGSFTPYYWSIDLEGKSEMKLTERLKIYGRLNGFKGSLEMPSSERIGLGGIGAGSSHESGLYTGYKGTQYEASARYTISQAGNHRILGRAGLNGAEIYTVTKDRLLLESGEIGAELHTGNWSIIMTLSKSIKTANLDSDQRLNAQMVWRY